MTPKDHANYVRFRTKTNSTTFDDTDLELLTKVAQDEIVREILKADEDIFCIESSENLVEDQRQYPFSASILSRLKRVEAKLDGTNWLVLDPIDVNDYRYPTDETNITYNFANLEGECFYEIRHRGIYIFSGSITDVTDGLKLLLKTYPVAIDDFTSETDMATNPSNITHGIPREVHELLGRRTSIIWKESKEKPIPLDELELKYDIDLRKAINSIRFGNLDEEVIGTLPPADDRGNDGFNY